MRNHVFRRGLTVLILLILAPACLLAADPFYEARLRDGLQAASRDDHARAVKNLRIACFGMLDEPPELASCLTRLALSQGALLSQGVLDQEELVRTLQRLVEVEDRFQGYTQADLTPEDRADLEGYLGQFIHYETLRSIGAFAEAARLQVYDRIANLPPRERRDELTAKLAEEPGSPAWRHLAAELDFESGRYQETLTHLEQLPAQDERTRCLQTWSLARLERCGEAADAAPHCTTATTDIDTAKNLVQCVLDARGPDAAQTLLQGLDPSLRNRPALRRLNRQVEERLAAQENLTESPSAEAPVTSEPEVSTGPVLVESVLVESGEEASSEPAPSEPNPTADRRWLAIVRQMLEAPSAKQVKEGYDQVRQIAEDYPNDQEAQHLAAEFAFRLRRWDEAVDYFERGGVIGNSLAQRQFFFAIALYETGQRERAAELLEQCQERLQKTPFVLSYIDKILGSSP